jgi:hypothetical protein
MGAVFHSDTSRIWTGWLAGLSEVRLFSVDAGQRDTPPRKEKGDTLRMDSRGTLAVEKPVSVTGRPGWGGRLERTDRQAFYAVVQSAYTCDVPIEARVLACWGQGDYGAVATLTAQGAGGRVTMRKLAANSVGRPADMVASADGRTLLFAVPKDSWYTVPVDGSAAPKRQFRRLAIGYAMPIDWI